MGKKTSTTGEGKTASKQKKRRTSSDKREVSDGNDDLERQVAEDDELIHLGAIDKLMEKIDQAAPAWRTIERRKEDLWLQRQLVDDYL